VVTDSAGRQLRFCQQCTRLEPLANFNGGRRSCKTSLAKRQARAHRGKAPSSPDSSPERAIARAPSSSDGEAASAAASSWRGTSRHSSGGGTVSKRSRASAVPSASTSNPAAALAGSTHGDPPRLAAPAPAPAPLPAPLPPDDMLWSSSLCGSDIEELLALDAEALADALRVPQAPGPCPDAPTHPLAPHQPWRGGGGGSVLGGSQPALGGGPPAAGPPLFGAAPGVPASAVPTLWLPAAPGLAPAAQPGTMAGPQAAPPLCGPEQWGAQPEAAAVASMRAAASGVAAGVRHAYPLHVITRFSLKVGRAGGGEVSGRVRRVCG
jgi:DNA polymerase-3 subunit gamma/tau